MLFELRQELEKIPLLKNIKDQKEKIKDLSSKFNHTIITKCSDDVISEEFGLYNCFAYALNLVDSDGYLKIASTFPRNVFANSEFIEFLLINGEELWCQILNCELHSSLFTIQDLTPIFAFTIQDLTPIFAKRLSPNSNKGY